MDDLQMNAAVEELHQLPHNQIRKAMTLKTCIKQMEDLRHRFSPAFDNDAAVNSVLEQLRAEHDTVMAELRRREDATDLLVEVLAEDDADQKIQKAGTYIVQKHKAAWEALAQEPNQKGGMDNE